MPIKQKLKTSIIPPDDDLDFTLWTLINQSRDAIYRVRQNELAKYGITAMETNALFHILSSEGNPTAAEISRRMFREHPTVSALLTRMKRNGLITKYRDTKKKNVWRLRVTEKGQNSFCQSLKRESLHTVMGVCPEEEKRVLCQCLKKIRDMALGQLATGPTITYP